MSEPRRRGAPRGNRNAFKHGFYARPVNPAGSQDLPASTILGLQDEIDMLRACMRGAIEIFPTLTNPQDSLNLLRAIALLSTCLNRLIRTHALVTGPTDKIQQDFKNAIASVLAELEESPPPSPGIESN
jgi:hypothetical protein